MRGVRRRNHYYLIKKYFEETTENATNFAPALGVEISTRTSLFRNPLMGAVCYFFVAILAHRGLLVHISFKEAQTSHVSHSFGCTKLLLRFSTARKKKLISHLKSYHLKRVSNINFG